MPALPPVASTLLCRLKGVNGPTKWNNIFYIRYSGTQPTSADLTTLGGVVGNAWTTNLAPLANLNVSLTGVDLVDLTSPTAASASVTMSHAGTRAGPGFTAQVAMVGSWQANLRFRGGHFRNYWPFGVSTDVASIATWSTVFQTAAAAGLGAFRTAINASTTGTATNQLVGVSYHTAHALRPTPVVVPINAVAVHGRIDTQRRRLGKETP